MITRLEITLMFNFQSTLCRHLIRTMREYTSSDALRNYIRSLGYTPVQAEKLLTTMHEYSIIYYDKKNKRVGRSTMLPTPLINRKSRKYT